MAASIKGVVEDLGMSFGTKRGARADGAAGARDEAAARRARRQALGQAQCRLTRKLSRLA